MNIPSIVKNNPVVAIAAVGAVIAVLWLVTRGAKKTGEDIGGGIVNLAFGTASGAGNAVVDNFNDPSVNPLHGLGTTIGGKIYDWTH